MFYHFIYLAKGIGMRPKVRSTLSQLLRSHKTLAVLNYTTEIFLK